MPLVLTIPYHPLGTIKMILGKEIQGDYFTCMNVKKIQNLSTFVISPPIYHSYCAQSVFQGPHRWGTDTSTLFGLSNIRTRRVKFVKEFFLWAP